MRRLLHLATAALASGFAVHAHASCTTPITAGMNASQIQTAINSCSSGDTASFPAATYSLSGGLSVLCGVSITGPAVSPGPFTTGDGYRHWGYSPTAILNFNGVGLAFNFGSCSSTHAVEYLEVNMNHPSPDGGQVLYHSGGAGNVTIFGNYFHGNQSHTGSGGGSNGNDGLIYFSGGSSSSGNNIVIEWNRLGTTGDCSNIMNNAASPNSNGVCTGINFATSETNLTIQNNTTDYQEQGQKFIEGTANGMYTCLNCTVRYNDWSEIHRIDFEEQINKPGSTSSPSVSLIVRYNSMHDPHLPNSSSYGLSIANGCGDNNPSPGGCVSNVDDNVIIDNVATTGDFNGLGIEHWSGVGGTGNSNLVQGQWSNSIDIAQDGAMTYSNNLVQSSYGAGGSNNSAYCYPGYAGAYGWWAVEDSPANTPSGSGNVCQFWDGSVQTSVTPTISPAAGTYASPQTVIFGNPGTGRDSNTTIWYTTDGSTPACAAGTSRPVADGATITVSSSAIVKAIGMWGAPNQPCSYPVGPLGGDPLGGHCSGGQCSFGYQPSTVVTNTYTIGGAPSLTSCSSTNSGPVSTVAVGSTVQQVGRCTYASVPVTTNCSPGADTYGNSITAWSASDGDITVGAVGSGSPGMVTGAAAGTAYVNATATGGITCSAYLFTVTSSGGGGASSPYISGATVVSGQAVIP